MKNTTIGTVLVSVALMLLSACAQKTASYSAVEDSLAVAEMKSKAISAQKEKKQEAVEQLIEATPSWYLKTPSPDTVGMFGAGTGTSDSIRIAISKAKLRATFNLAKLYKKELAGSERDFQRDSGEGTIVSQYEQLIDELVKASIVGEQVVEQKVKGIDGRVHAWVLLKLPYDEFNKILKQRSAQAQDKVIQSAFDDLERRLDKRRKQSLEDAQIKQNMELKSLKERNAIILKSQKASDVTTQVSGTPQAAAKPQDDPMDPLESKF